ncbi:hypothetical protein KIW84_024564 [Lathyrus oleraceus]|uniref:Uncharacterized protein n=1 Tax=Pisum sativum TaxID=3888 RepID=A0A9D4YKI3_PEA|nr:hypothetical protein KIW84_024564 [Pisum sativum]
MSSLSCPSEPPDVGNWFSSYEYQSPNLDSDFTLEESSFGKCKSLHIDEEQEGAVREKLVQCNEDLCFTKNMDSCSLCSLFSEPPNIRNWFSSYNYESSAFDTCSLLNDEEVSDGNKCVAERFDFKVINKDETKTEIVQPKVCVKHNSSFDVSYGMKKNINTANTSHLEKILQPCMQVKELQYSLGSTKHNETVNRNCGSPGCNGEAHFMSLDTHTSEMRPPNLVQKHGTEEAKSKVEIQAEKLDINTEATNLQQSNAIEIIGKWQCPQKRKLDKEPALKQLRLERWVHKVENVSPVRNTGSLSNGYSQSLPSGSNLNHSTALYSSIVASGDDTPELHHRKLLPKQLLVKEISAVDNTLVVMDDTFVNGTETSEQIYQGILAENSRNGHSQIHANQLSASGSLSPNDAQNHEVCEPKLLMLSPNFTAVKAR